MEQTAASKSASVCDALSNEPQYTNLKQWMFQQESLNGKTVPWRQISPYNGATVLLLTHGRQSRMMAMNS